MAKRIRKIPQGPCKTCGAYDRQKSGNCRPCHKIKHKIYRDSNKEKIKEQIRIIRHKNKWNYLRTRLMKEHSLTLEDYFQMLERQKNLCAICSNPPSSNKRLCVDHCHMTNKVRELLCDRCNTTLGKFEENIELFKQAINYLERHKNCTEKT